MFIQTKLVRTLLLANCLTLAVAVDTHAAVADFESVAMPNEQTYTGPGGGRYWSGLVPSSGGSVNSSFNSGSGTFFNTNNECCGGFTFWNGFSYSNTTDTTTAGFTNQYSAFTGGGVDGSSNYAVAYQSPRIEFASPVLVNGGYFTNTTYAALSMLNGDSFAKAFGGDTGDDPDFFKLLINGEDAFGNTTGTVEFFLADFTFTDNTLDYIVDSWEYVTLSSLGLVSALTFGFESTDVGAFGINTPLYFAMDNLSTVPVPASIWLLGTALIGLLSVSRRNSAIKSI